jgi:hypothetical protein
LKIISTEVSRIVPAFNDSFAASGTAVLGASNFKANLFSRMSPSKTVGNTQSLMM